MIKNINDFTIDNASEKASFAEQNHALVKSLERALRNEKLLRKISDLIISDQPAKDIAQTVADLLCGYLKIDRCLIHDSRKGIPTFFAEYRKSGARAIIEEDKKNLEELQNYIDFQQKFYKKPKNGNGNSSFFIIKNIYEDLNFKPLESFYKKFNISSQIAVKTSIFEEMNCGVYIYQESPYEWTKDEIELIELITEQLSIAIDRSYSIEKVMIANHNLLEKTLELREAVKKEKQLRKMQNEFVALVSHEFKTPLQIIDSTRELLMRKLRSSKFLDDSLEKYLDRIKNGVARMSGLINSTLNLAKIENSVSDVKAEKQSFDLHFLLNEIIEKTTTLTANKGIKIITKFCPKSSKINGDEKLLDHCFTNIISNAIKYSITNGSIRLITKASSSKIAVRIIDNGIGIPEEDLANIGNKFFRARNTLAVSGTGIGIYLTKYFVELHQGSVLIKSKLGVGTSITIILPLL